MRYFTNRRNAYKHVRELKHCIKSRYDFATVDDKLFCYLCGELFRKDRVGLLMHLAEKPTFDDGELN